VNSSKIFLSPVLLFNLPVGLTFFEQKRLRQAFQKLFISLLHKWLASSSLNSSKIWKISWYFWYFRYFRKYHNIFQPCWRIPSPWNCCIAIYTAMLGQQQYLFRQRAGRPRPEGQSPSKLGTILRATKEKQNKKTEKKNYATLSYSACEFMHELNKTQARSQGGCDGCVYGPRCWVLNYHRITTRAIITTNSWTLALTTAHMA